MQDNPILTNVYPAGETASGTFDVYTSGVSWGAVLAGAAAAAALSFILLILGVGLGLSAVSPWSYSANIMGKSTIIWLAFTQLAAAGIGGYIAGRLRVKWAGVHSDEVYFRDTAHGLLAWAVATLLTAVLMAGAIHAVLGGAVDIAVGAESVVATPVAKGAMTDLSSSPVGYFSDVLLRSDQAAPETDNGAMRAEVARIFVNDMRAGGLTPDDLKYLAKLVIKRTRMAPAAAERRVEDVYARMNNARADAEATAKNAADRAREAAAHSALWMFIALLLGAFFASLCATFGGRQRDSVVTAIAR